LIEVVSLLQLHFYGVLAIVVLSYSRSLDEHFVSIS